MTDLHAGSLLQAAEGPMGVRLHPRQRDLLHALDVTPSGVWACGRRGGKTMLCSIVGLYDLLFRPDLDYLVRPGEPRYSVVVATNQEQGRVALRSARLIVDGSPLLRQWLSEENQDELVFRRDGHVMVLKVFPCSSRGIRGYPVSAAIMDEAAHFVSTDDGDRAAQQVYAALRPAVAQFGNAGRMLVVSSPSGSTGWFADLWGKADRGELSGWEAQQVSTQEMNPSVPADFLEQVERDEPDTFGSEYLALFESGGSAFFDLIRFEMVDGMLPALPEQGVTWFAGLDPAVSSDSFGVALLGLDRSSRLVVGPVEAIEPERRRGWTFERKRQATDRVLARVAEPCLAYNAARDHRSA